MSTGRELELSIIIPSYNEQDNIQRTFHSIDEILRQNHIPYEIIFVDDGSKDLTFTRIQELSLQSGQVKGISFSRNFGKEAAIFAGLESAGGACCLIMDCDLQHPPRLIPEMYRLWQEGYEVVEGIKASRGKENLLHTFSANTFYSLISRATGIDMSRASDFKLLDRKAMDALLIMPERAPFFRALSSWVGFKTTILPFEVQERDIGVSKWSVWSLTKYAVQNITSFSGAPMQLVSLLGFVMFFASVILGIQSLYRYFTGTALEGFTTVILLQLIIGSVLMISLGIIGHYISRIYDEIKARPRYIISKRCG
ncbi:putative glycosyltransferase [Lachnospiraceae bacterium]|nr:glycosyltransferase family 2 protein [Lachnospiraceae bacterium]GFI18753.1 putative glycosyltransferase [Lachnospiraceae bacterium]GFI69927.1 putative glycosyltransferase [Lachnospiraceae bacterium]